MIVATEIWVDAEAVEFWHNGVPRYASSVVYHQCRKQESGIGAYEYQGAKEVDNRYEYVSEFSKARFEGIVICTARGEEIKPSEEVLERAKEAMWNDTRSSAEEQAWDV